MITLPKEKQYLACENPKCRLHVGKMKAHEPCPGCGDMVKTVMRPRSQINFSIKEAYASLNEKAISANSRRRNTGWIKDGSRRATSARRPEPRASVPPGQPYSPFGDPLS